jgi:hypothetical protein
MSQIGGLAYFLKMVLGFFYSSIVHSVFILELVNKRKKRISIEAKSSKSIPSECLKSETDNRLVLKPQNTLTKKSSLNLKTNDEDRQKNYEEVKAEEIEITRRKKIDELEGKENGIKEYSIVDALKDALC